MHKKNKLGRSVDKPGRKTKEDTTKLDALNERWRQRMIDIRRQAKNW